MLYRGDGRDPAVRVLRRYLESTEWQVTLCGGPAVKINRYSTGAMRSG